MPRLHKHLDRDSQYALTKIGGKIVTFQLTPEGERKLAASGIGSGQPFPRALLLDLYRTGDAYTGGSGVVDRTAMDQLEMDFASDPDPDSAFPACDECGGVEELHLTVSGDAADRMARLECNGCRARATIALDTSVPLSLLTRPLLSRLLEMKSVIAKASNVVRYEGLLEAEFATKWDAVRKPRSKGQESLFNDGDLGGLRLE